MSREDREPVPIGIGDGLILVVWALLVIAFATTSTWLVVVAFLIAVIAPALAVRRN